MDSGLVTLYWHVGRRIRQDILSEKRAKYGAKIVSALGTQLSREFGRGFNARNLFRMVRFAEVFADDLRLTFCLKDHKYRPPENGDESIQPALS